MIILRSKNVCNSIGVYNANVLTEIVNLSIWFRCDTANTISYKKTNPNREINPTKIGRGGGHVKNAHQR